jgi:hypothetical protein
VDIFSILITITLKVSILKQRISFRTPFILFFADYNRPRSTPQSHPKDRRLDRSLVLRDMDSLHLAPRHCRFEPKSSFLISPRLTSTFLNDDQLNDLVIISLVTFLSFPYISFFVLLMVGHENARAYNGIAIRRSNV